MRARRRGDDDRDFFAPVCGSYGQQRNDKLNGFAGLAVALACVEAAVTALWTMQNGYAQCTRAGLDAITQHLTGLRSEQVDALRGKLCIRIHRDVEVTEAAKGPRPLVSQAFCSALPVAYGRSVPAPHWKAFGSQSWKQRTKPRWRPPC